MVALTVLCQPSPHAPTSVSQPLACVASESRERPGPALIWLLGAEPVPAGRDLPGALTPNKMQISQDRCSPCLSSPPPPPSFKQCLSFACTRGL